MTVKDELHELVDQLDEEAAREALAQLQDLGRREAPMRDEPVTDKEEGVCSDHQCRTH
jgi:hypothetical protein